MLALLREHGDHIEADLQRYFQTNIGALWTGGLSLRRLRVLLDHLPSESALMRELSGVPRDHPLHGWTLAEVLTARALDELAVFRWQWESTHRGKGPGRKAPTSVLPDAPRGKQSPPAEVVSPHQLGEFINGEGGDLSGN